MLFHLSNCLVLVFYLWMGINSHIVRFFCLLRYSRHS